MNTNQNFWFPDGKFWWPIFLLRIRTKRTRLCLGPQWRFIHLPLKNHDEWIECRLYTQFHKTAKCFKSTLYLLLSLPFGEETSRLKKLPVGSLLYVQNRKRSFLSGSVKTIDGSPCCSHQATTKSISRLKNMAAELRTARAVKRCDRFIITGKSVLYFKSSGKVKSKWPIGGQLWILLLSIWLKIKVIVCIMIVAWKS